MKSLFPIRDRYLRTRYNRVRLRYVVLPTALLLALVAMVGFSTNSLAIIKQQGKSYRVVDAKIRDDADRNSSLVQSLKELETNIQQAAISLPPSLPSWPQPKEKTVQIGKGDTLSSVLERAGLSMNEIYYAIESMGNFFDPRLVKPGQSLSVQFDPVNRQGDAYRFSSLSMPLDALRTVSLTHTPSGDFEAFVVEKEAQTRQYTKSFSIETSLYGSALRAGLPVSVIAEAIRIYSWDVDFQRDIRRDDTLKVMYEQLETPEGTKIKTGNILYAHLNVNGQDIPVYRFETKNGDVDYFTKEGQSIRKALMKTPVDGARISSGFGYRKHPVLGYNKLHKGVDFAAPTGTPIYAAGDGTIERANRFGAYGNYIRIRHNSQLKTAYAHLNGFAKGVTTGKRVKQGEIIGYIGTTGRSTGPHLHYEVLLNNEQANPNKIDLPQGEILKGAELVAFKAHIQDVDNQYASLEKGDVRLASAQ